MPSKPNPNSIKENLTATTVDISNNIRMDLGGSYREATPFLDRNDIRTLYALGESLFSNQTHMNAYLSNLQNRIAFTLITSKLWKNKLAFMKKGKMEFGETVQELFVNMAKVYDFNPENAEKTVYKRVIPSVLSAYHTMNFQKQYQETIENERLRTAFLSWDGITDLIGKIVESMYTAMNFDEYIVMKYMIARATLNGHIMPTNILAISPENMKPIATTIKALSNKWETTMSRQYNMAGVRNYANKNDQFLIMNSQFNATMDVEVLASAFNMDKAEFMGHQVLIDSFSDIDAERLDELFSNDKSYVPFTPAEITQLESIPAVMLSRDWFMIFDNFQTMTEQYNAKGLYWNYFLTDFKTLSISPFAVATVFTTAVSAVTSLTVTPKTATVSNGGVVQLTVAVVTTGFASKGVSWTMSGQTSSASTINEATGLIHIGLEEEATTINVTCTSLFDSSKSDTAVITIAN